MTPLEQIQRTNRICLRLAWLAEGKPIDLVEFTADVHALLLEQHLCREVARTLRAQVKQTLNEDTSQALQQLEAALE